MRQFPGKRQFPDESTPIGTKVWMELAPSGRFVEGHIVGPDPAFTAHFTVEIDDGSGQKWSAHYTSLSIIDKSDPKPAEDKLKWYHVAPNGWSGEYAGWEDGVHSIFRTVLAASPKEAVRRTKNLVKGSLLVYDADFNLIQSSEWK